ncbi:MAG: hypothetical protein KJO69_11200 [Gammaproteobacteria bacterium]|nr:hypothetical protein [Gammaproteobacteria bacterium]
MSKGSKQRPKQISDEEMQRRWELAFGKINFGKIKKNTKDKKYHMNVEIK